MQAASQSTTENDRQMTCPTCGAGQAITDECRRCRSDLRDLRAVWRASDHARDACLRALRAGDFDRALEHSRRFAQLLPGQEAARLLGVCSLLREDWSTALRCIWPET